jgi:bacterioferritin-associated ferredoxin
MIVCHCNRIDHSEIEQAANALASDDHWTVLTPVAVYKALGKRPCCGRCLPLAASVIHSRRAGNTPSCETCPMAMYSARSERGVQSPPLSAADVLEAAE